MSKFLVRYDYNGGRGSEIVEADDIEQATESGMQRATPTWASDQASPCRHLDTVRLVARDEQQKGPTHGIETVIVYSYMSAPERGPWLVVERGEMNAGGSYGLVWTRGVLVGGYATRRGAKNVCSRCEGTAALKMRSAAYHVVHRDAVEVVRRSTGEYGCITGRDSAAGLYS